MEELLMKSQAVERRKSKRKRASSLIWWKPSAAKYMQQGWLIERSGVSVGFLYRGNTIPRQATPFTMLTNTHDGSYLVEEGFISRIEHVHEDVRFIGATVNAAGRT